MTATREQLEAVIRDQLGRVTANALTAGVPSRGMFNRAVEAITRAAGLDTPPGPVVHLITASLDLACGHGGQDRSSSVVAEVTCRACKDAGEVA